MKIYYLLHFWKDGFVLSKGEGTSGVNYLEYNWYLYIVDWCFNTTFFEIVYKMQHFIRLVGNVLFFNWCIIYIKQAKVLIISRKSSVIRVFTPVLFPVLTFLHYLKLHLKQETIAFHFHIHYTYLYAKLLVCLFVCHYMANDMIFWKISSD